eukprot:4168928-Amphidinium_carterae.2
MQPCQSNYVKFSADLHANRAHLKALLTSNSNCTTLAVSAIAPCANAFVNNCPVVLFLWVLSE